MRPQHSIWSTGLQVDAGAARSATDDLVYVAAVSIPWIGSNLAAGP